MSKVYVLVDERLMAAKNAKRSRHPRHFIVAAYSTMKNAQEAADGYLEALSFAPAGNGWKQGKLKGEIAKTESSGKKSDKYGVLHSTYRDDEAVLGHLRILTLTVNQPPEDEIDYMTAETFGAESKFDKLAKEIAADYRKKGKSPEEAMEIGEATAAKIGRAKFGKRKFARMGKSAESVTNFKGEMKTLVQTYVELLYPDDLDMQDAIFENITSGKESVSLKEMQDYVATRSSWYAEIEAVNPSMAVIHNQNDDFVGSIEVLDDSDDPDSVEVFVNDDQMNEVSSTNLYEDGQFWEDYDAETFEATDVGKRMKCRGCSQWEFVRGVAMNNFLQDDKGKWRCYNCLYDKPKHKVVVIGRGKHKPFVSEAETFNAENEIMVHQLISPYETGGYSTTYIYRDEKDLMDAIWHDHACERMETYEEEYPEYDWDGYIDSDENRAIFDKKTKDMSIDEILEYSHLDYDLYYKKIPLNLEGFSVDGEYGDIRNLTRNSGILRAETFNAERQVYVLRFGDPMRYGKAVELPFLTKNEAERYVDMHIRPWNKNHPWDEINYSITQETQFNAETFEAQLSFDRWSKDEMNEELHGGRDMNFEDWLEDEVHTHGNIPLKEWGDEEESESEHQHAEFNAAKGIDTYAEPLDEIGSFYSGKKGIVKVVGLGSLVAAGIWITKNKLLE